jgi:chemotaxis protein methyltransferase CheR
MEERLERALAPWGGESQQAYEHLAAAPEELAEIANVLRVGETCFYRDPPQWDALRAHVFPHLARRRHLMGISVGCSTGEEAWTLAALLAETQGVNWRVVGFDRSGLALESARAGRYPLASVRHLPRDWREHHLQDESDVCVVKGELRSRTAFVQGDLAQGLPRGAWELMVCKNVLLYFGELAQVRAAECLAASLAPGGYLMVARSEVPILRQTSLIPVEISPGITVFRRGEG